MERQRRAELPQHILTIAGTQLDILRFLDAHQLPVLSADRMKPGDNDALQLLYVFDNLGVTPDEYQTAMPNFLRLAAKEEGGFDADLLTVARYLMKKVVDRRGGERALLYKGTQQDRIAYFADVYGQLQAVKDFVWRSPQLADHKKQIVEFAKNDLSTPWPWDTRTQ